MARNPLLTLSEVTKASSKDNEAHKLLKSHKSAQQMPSFASKDPRHRRGMPVSHWKLLLRVSPECVCVCQRCFWLVLRPLDRLLGFLCRISIQLRFSHSRLTLQACRRHCSQRRRVPAILQQSPACSSPRFARLELQARYPGECHNYSALHISKGL